MTATTTSPTATTSKTQTNSERTPRKRAPHCKGFEKFSTPTAGSMQEETRAAVEHRSREEAKSEARAKQEKTRAAVGVSKYERTTRNARRCRTTEKEGEPLFCLVDVARALKYANPANAVANYCKGVTIIMTPTAGGMQKMKYGAEREVYRLTIKYLND